MRTFTSLSAALPLFTRTCVYYPAHLVTHRVSVFVPKSRYPWSIASRVAGGGQAPRLCCVLSFSRRGDRNETAMEPGRWARVPSAATGRAVPGRRARRRPELPQDGERAGGCAGRQGGLGRVEGCECGPGPPLLALPSSAPSSYLCSCDGYAFPGSPGGDPARTLPRISSADKFFFHLGRSGNVGG